MHGYQLLCEDTRTNSNHTSNQRQHKFLTEEASNMIRCLSYGNLGPRAIPHNIHQIAARNRDSASLLDCMQNKVVADFKTETPREQASCRKTKCVMYFKRGEREREREKHERVTKGPDVCWVHNSGFPSARWTMHKDPG
jgi:hypothetical protein